MDAFLQEIEAHKDEFYRYVLRNVWDSGVADDVFSSAVLAAYKSRKNFQVGTNFRAWMYRILTNKCFVANREIGRRGKSLDEVEEYISLLAEEPSYKASIKNPQEFLDMCGDEVHIAMRKLSTMERSCLLLKTMENFSYKELASILDIPFGTVMTHLARGRAKLRTELFEYAQKQGIETEKGAKSKEPIKFDKRKAQ
ncbi:MAG: RNA polymerase sigma factor [Lentisphaeraceae bacterium]|nr:RNA polymerase sigma factor [Lentisphaeraceae bacterium]